uniref:Replication factor A C-terminal domain-containing protein n=1 Tax=Brassica oleracea var. oleracea TaxID=109376 RepID=A0A0D2ZWM3_BRAOL
MTDVNLYYRDRVELSVDDGSDNATFVVFDRKMLKLTKQDAAVLALDEMNGGGGDELPHCLKELDGKDFVFQIRVTPYNFTSNHRTFTVSGISDHINPSSIVEGEGSEASASVSNTLGGQGDEPNPSGYEGKEGGGRKRP